MLIYMESVRFFNNDIVNDPSEGLFSNSNQ